MYQCYENEPGVTWKPDQRYFVWVDFDCRRSPHWAVPNDVQYDPRYEPCSIWPPFRSMHCLARPLLQHGARKAAGGAPPALLHHWGLRDFLGCFGKHGEHSFRHGSPARVYISPENFVKIDHCVWVATKSRRTRVRRAPRTWPCRTFSFHLKSQVYRNNPRSLEDLNDAVKAVVRRLPISVCHAEAEATIRRAKQYIERNWGHIEHVFGAAQYGDRQRSGYPQTKYLWSGFQMISSLFS